MAGIFTRSEITKIINNSELTPEQRTDEIFSLYGRAVDDGFVTRKAAETATNAAIEAAKQEWEKAQQAPNVKESEEYKALEAEFSGYKTREAARRSEDFKDVKPKFFDMVYDRIDRKEGAKPISEQLAGLRKEYEEYFNPAEEPPKKPQFGAPTGGAMPSGEESAVAAMAKVWGITPKK